MFKNYLVSAIRNIRRHKLYSFINISGLAIGIAASSLIYFWLLNELSYDKFHKNSLNIYRLERSWDFREMHGQAPLASGPWGPALVQDYPEILDYVRLENTELYIKDYRNKFHKEQLFVVDNSIFNVFDFKLLSGSSENALTEPKTAVITKEYASKYLDSEDVIGKSITIDWADKHEDFKITGILDEVPQNSHIQFDILLSLSSYPQEVLSYWFGNQHYTYLLLENDISMQELETKLPPFLDKYVATEFTKYFGPDIGVTDVFKIKLRPLLDLHLHPSREFEIAPQGDAATVTIFTVISILILLIACINYINLSTARANKRAKEVGLRKTIGAQKNQLIIQYLTESVFITLIALGLALVIINISIPFANNLFGKSLSQNMLYKPLNWIVLICITVVTAFFAGLFPAFYLTKFQPIQVLRGINTGKEKSIIRKSMTVIQFAISISIVIGTLVVFKQMKFIQNKSLGFNKDNIITLSAESSTVKNNIESFKNELLANPEIESVSASSNIPGTKIVYDTNFKRSDNGKTYNLMIMSTDYDFYKTYGLDVAWGRELSKEYSTDEKEGFILNERALISLGYKPEEALGKELIVAAAGDQKVSGKIVGIVKDFHLQSLHLRILPIVFSIASQNEISKISIKTTSGDFNKTLDFIKNKWDSNFNGEIFEYGILDQKLDYMYLEEQRIQKVFSTFAFLSIFIACLGLFGLSVFTAEEKTKEIGIRKVLGASIPEIMGTLLKEFTKWIIIANLFAWPAAWFIMKKWLQNYAYRTELTVGIFIIAGITGIIIALFTISFQTFKAATANPVKALQYE